MYKFIKVFFAFSLFSILTILSPLCFAQKTDLIGKTTSKEIREQHKVFDVYTKRYTPNSESLNYLADIKDSVKIFVLFGTWCHDSKKQIPAFIKTMEEADNPNIDIEYIAVSRKKKEPQKLIERWNLKLTPTFIIYREGQEYGRIIEEPTQSIEQDLVSILKSEAISDQ